MGDKSRSESLVGASEDTLPLGPRVTVYILSSRAESVRESESLVVAAPLSIPRNAASRIPPPPHCERRTLCAMSIDAGRVSRLSGYERSHSSHTTELTELCL